MTSHQQIAIEKTMEVSKYMKTLFNRYLHNKNADVEMPDHWTLEFLQEIHYMVHVLVNAAQNPGIFTKSYTSSYFQLM